GLLTGTACRGMAISARSDGARKTPYRRTWFRTAPGRPGSGVLAGLDVLGDQEQGRQDRGVDGDGRPDRGVEAAVVLIEVRAPEIAEAIGDPIERQEEHHHGALQTLGAGAHGQV